MFTIQQNCIICKTPLQNLYFETDLQTYPAHYATDTPSSSPHLIPFNIYKCDRCETAQLKYLGKLEEIYRINHADSTGKTMKELHEQTRSMILRNANSITNILEVGSSVGFLADLILDTLNINYYIIEPCYKGSYRENKHILHDFYENIDDTLIPANTLIISHVFEHFYNPSEILEKISQNQNIEHFYLVWPNLEYYMQHNILHVLNTEHIYYIDNTFLVNLLDIYGFKLVEQEDYKGHSVLFYFRRQKGLSNLTNPKITFKNTIIPLDTFFNKIQQTVRQWNVYIQENKNKRIYVWPASIHCLYLFQFGLSTHITGLLDNSLNKINRYIYGYNIPIYSFKDILQQNSPDTVILLNGGVFNKDIEAECNLATNIEFIFVE